MPSALSSLMPWICAPFWAPSMVTGPVEVASVPAAAVAQLAGVDLAAGVRGRSRSAACAQGGGGAGEQDEEGECRIRDPFDSAPVRVPGAETSDSRGVPGVGCRDPWL